MRHCISKASVVANANANYCDITFTIKDIKLHAPLINLSPKDNQKLSKLLSKGFARSAH